MLPLLLGRGAYDGDGSGNGRRRRREDEEDEKEDGGVEAEDVEDEEGQAH